MMRMCLRLRNYNNMYYIRRMSTIIIENNDEILELIRKGSCHKLKNTYDPSKHNKMGSHCVKEAIVSGNLQILKYVFDNFNKNFTTIPLLDKCAEHNNVKAFKWIYNNKRRLLRQYPNIIIDFMPFTACANNIDKPEMAQYLIDKYHPRPKLELPLVVVAVNNQIKTFRIWWPVAYKSGQVRMNLITGLASQAESIDILDYLWKRHRNNCNMDHIRLMAEAFNAQKTLEWMESVV